MKEIPIGNAIFITFVPNIAEIFLVINVRYLKTIRMPIFTIISKYNSNFRYFLFSVDSIFLPNMKFTYIPINKINTKNGSPHA